MDRQPAISSVGRFSLTRRLTVSNTDDHIYNKPLVLHSQAISVLEDLMSDNARQNFNRWYYKPHKMFIGGGLLEQMVNGADDHIYNSTTIP